MWSRKSKITAKRCASKEFIFTKDSYQNPSATDCHENI
jgi:hypothetical protein